MNLRHASARPLAAGLISGCLLLCAAGLAHAAEDFYEENDTRETAADISAAAGVRLSSWNASYGYQNDEDWFAITVAPGNGRVQASIAFKNKEGNLSLDLFPAAGEDWLTTSRSLEDYELIDFNVLFPGTYYLRVSGPDLGTQYDLWWNALPLAGDDQYEQSPNNSIATAVNATGFAGHWLTNLDGPGILRDVDYYRINPTDDATRVVIDARFHHSEGDLDLQLLDGAGNILAQSLGTGDRELINFVVPAAGSYYIRVIAVSYSGAQDYNLYWNRYPAADDAYEHNNGVSEAFDITPHGTLHLSTLRGQGIQADEDTFAIHLSNAPLRLLVTLRFKHAAGNMGLQLFDPQGLPLAVVDGTADFEILDVLISDPGLYVVRVFGEDRGNTYDLWWGATAEAGDDFYEDNDTQPFSRTLVTTPGQWLTDLKGPGIIRDVDFYTVSTNAPDQWLHVVCLFDHDQQDIDLQLFDSMGTPLAESVSRTDFESLHVQLPNQGNYFVRVFHFGPGGGTYNLLWNRESGNDDAYENNDSAAAACNLSPFMGQRLSRIMGPGRLGDLDYFTFDVPEGMLTLFLRLTYDFFAGDVNWRLYDPDQMLIDEGTNQSNEETARLTLPKPGRYTIQFYGQYMGNPYDFVYRFGPTGDDTFEQNDTRLGAFNLAPHAGEYLTQIGGLGIQLDDEWFRIQMPDGLTHLFAQLISIAADGNLDLELYGIGGNLVDASRANSNYDLLDFELPQPGEYWLRVVGNNSGQVYDLRHYTLAPGDDLYEENDTPQQATNLKFLAGTYLSLINGFGYQTDDDWFTVETGPNDQRLVVEVLFKHDLGNIDLEVYDSTGQTLLGQQISLTDNEGIDLPVSPNTEYKLRLYGANVATARYNLWWDGMPPHPSGDDNYEQNDSPNSAANLAQAEGQWLSTFDGGARWLDRDYYLLPVPAERERVVVHLRHDLENIDAVLRLFDPEGALVAQHQSSADTLVLGHLVDGPGDYILEVAPVTGLDTFNYDLIWWAVERGNAVGGPAWAVYE